MATVFKIAMNTFHIGHPLNCSQSQRYQKWQKKGVITFAIATILSGGVVGIIILSTAAAKWRKLKKLENSTSTTRVANEAIGNVPSSYQQDFQFESRRARTKNRLSERFAREALRLERESGVSGNEGVTRPTSLTSRAQSMKRLSEKYAKEALYLEAESLNTQMGHLYKRAGNYQEAITSYTEAAVEGKDPEAQFSLGEIYENGEGVPQILQQALYWYDQCDKNDPSYRDGEAGRALTRVQAQMREETRLS